MKKIIAIIMAVVFAMCMAGCNYKMLDTKYHFDKAIILLPDGTIVEGEVEKWSDYEGEQIQVTIDGVTYLTSTFNCILIG